MSKEVGVAHFHVEILEREPDGRPGSKFLHTGEQFFQSLGYAGVEPHPTRQAQLLSQGFLNQGVGELVPIHCLGQFLDVKPANPFAVSLAFSVIHCLPIAQ